MNSEVVVRLHHHDFFLLLLSVGSRRLAISE
jgi:hypothetical protein